MKGIRITVLLAVLSTVGCGGDKWKPKKPPPPPEEEIVRIPTRKPDKEPEPPPPPPAQEWRAKVNLAPVKRAKMKRGVVKFWQTEGEGMSLTGAFDGLKPGRYHFVVHAGTECGKNATKAGPAWDVASSVEMPVDVAKKATGPIEMTDLSLMLGGENTIVGHAMVLHADKKGKPSKAVACGVITAEEPAAEPAGEAEDEGAGEGEGGGEEPE